MYQALRKVSSNGNVSVEKPKVLFMAPTGVAGTNIDDTTKHVVLDIPVSKFEKNLQPLSDMMYLVLSTTNQLQAYQWLVFTVSFNYHL